LSVSIVHVDDIEPSYANPIAGTRFLELELRRVLVALSADQVTAPYSNARRILLPA
jgi:hypothetical protein